LVPIFFSSSQAAAMLLAGTAELSVCDAAKNHASIVTKRAIKFWDQSVSQGDAG
jgi:hypothetical protein